MNINEPDNGPGFALPFHNQHNPTLNDRGSAAPNKHRLPFLSWMNDDVRNHFIAMSGEYAGTTLFLFFAFSGTQVALFADVPESRNEVGTPSNPAQLLYIALCFGFALAVNAWVFFRISGGLFNPAVTLGLCLVGALPYMRGALLGIVQILGGVTAAAIVSALFPGPLSVQSKLGAGTSITQGLFIEMFLTAQLIFTIFMLAAEKHRGTFIAPIGIGLSLFIAELTGVYYTGGSCNPARSFGPSVIDHSFPGYHWIYWAGPILGSLLASGFYKFIKTLEYESANPGQDGKQANHNPPMPNHVRFKSDPDNKGRAHGAARHANEFVSSNYNNREVGTNLGVIPEANGGRGSDGQKEHRRIGSDETLGEHGEMSALASSIALPRNSSAARSGEV